MTDDTPQRWQQAASAAAAHLGTEPNPLVLTDITCCESPAQVAARLMAGAGRSTVAAIDHATWGDPGPVVHGRGPDGESLLAVRPDADSPWRHHTPGQAIASVVAIDDYAPLVDVRIHMADARVLCTLRRTRHAERYPLTQTLGGTITEALPRIPEWTGHQVYSVHPKRVTVHCQTGAGDVPLAHITKATIDPVAADQFWTIQRLLEHDDLDWHAIMAHHLIVGGADAPFRLDDVTSVRLVSVDTHGFSVVAVVDDLGHPVRIPFRHRITGPRHVLAAVRDVCP